MAAETKRLRIETTIRAFRPADAAVVRRILKESPQAADWTEASLRESAEWLGIVSLVNERNGEITALSIGGRCVPMMRGTISKGISLSLPASSP